MGHGVSPFGKVLLQVERIIHFSQFFVSGFQHLAEMPAKKKSRSLSACGLGSLFKFLSNCIPIDDIPKSINVIGATILIIQIIGMFPDINA